MKQHPKYDWLFLTETGDVYSNTRGLRKLSMFGDNLVKIKVSEGVSTNKGVAQLVWETYHGLYDKEKYEVKSGGSVSLCDLSLVPRLKSMKDKTPKTPHKYYVTVYHNDGSIEFFEGLDSFSSSFGIHKSKLQRLRRKLGDEFFLDEERRLAHEDHYFYSKVVIKRINIKENV